MMKRTKHLSMTPNFNDADRLKTEFIGIASHQLRTPLATISWYVEMLTSGDVGALTEDQKVFLNEIQSSVTRMTRLVNDLLNASRLEMGRLSIKPRLTDLEALIRDSIHEVEPMAARNHSVIRFIAPKTKFSPVAIDETLFRQVIHNFLVNAVRYSFPGENLIEVSFARKGGAYVVGVSDEGIGIPKSAQKHIFEEFYRAENASAHVADGSGLGLYLAKMIMEASGGKIWFVSPTRYRKGKAGIREGHGSAFFASFPVKGMRLRKGERKLAE